MVTVVEVVVETPPVVTVNVPVVAPAATVTVAGTIRLALFDEILTTVPPVPAGPLKVTVAVEELPAVTDVGESETLVT